MKRAHRRWHRRAWPVAAAIAAVVIGLALAVRQAVPTNTTWPASIRAAASGGTG
jgi:hypothetical protein